MKDIDFDELDKAVSSVLSPATAKKETKPVTESPKKKSELKPDISKPVPAKEEPKQKSDDVKIEEADESSKINVEDDDDTDRIEVKHKSTSPVSDDNESPELPPKVDVVKRESIEEAAEKIIPEVEDEESPSEETSDSNQSEMPSSPILAPRRSGRFMDMVHPDADMQKEAVQSQAPASKGVRSLQPSAELIRESAESSEVKESEVSRAEEADQGEDLSETLKDVNLDGINTDADRGYFSDTQFINDDKVEKRPLGAFSDVQSQQEDRNNDNSSSPDSDDEKDETFHATRFESDDYQYRAPAKEESPKVEEPAPPSVDDNFPSRNEFKSNIVPRELEKDIVAVEADTITVHAKELHIQQPDERAAKNSDKLMTADAMVGAASVMSIPKQYKESAEAADTVQHPLFDTKEYHPPISRHVDSRQHKYVVVWVIIAMLMLIATAAGFGYWLYLQL